MSIKLLKIDNDLLFTTYQNSVIVITLLWGIIKTKK